MRAAERTVLVIGNPPPGPGFGRCLAPSTRPTGGWAFDAARSAAAWQVTARIWDGRGAYVGTHARRTSMTTDPAENVIHELMTGSWRVVHIAAHGTIDPGGDAALSGVVLGAGEPA